MARALSKSAYKPGLKTLQSEPNVYTNGKVYIMVYADDLLFTGEPEEVAKIFKKIQAKMLLRHTGTCTPNKTIDFLGRKITNKGDHFEALRSLWETATSTTSCKERIYRRQHQPSPQDPTALHPHQNRMNSLIQKSTPTTGAWSESFSGFHIHDQT